MKSKQGQTLIITKSGKMVPFAEFKSYEKVKKSRSKQIETDSQFHALIDGLRPRPYPPRSLFDLYEHCTPLSSTIDQIATDVTAGGFRYIPTEGNEEISLRDKDTLAWFHEECFSWPNTLRRLIKTVVTDWGVCGYWGIEVTRNGPGLVDGMIHVPAHTLWIFDEKSGKEHTRKYCQKRGMKKVWFKPFAQEQDLSFETGKLGEYSDVQRANEMLFYWEPHPKSEYYGLPRWISSTGNVLSLIYAREYNVSFFQHHGVPGHIVKLKGDWKEGFADELEVFIREACKGAGNAHRTMVVELPRDAEGNSGDLIIEPVEVQETREGAFRLQKKDDKVSIRSSFSMPPYRVGEAVEGDLGSNVARETTEIYKSSTIKPLQEDINEMMNAVYAQGLQVTTARFELCPFEIRDIDRETDREMKLLEHGCRTPNQVIQTLGLGEGYGPVGDQYYIHKRFIPVDEAPLSKMENGLDDEIDELFRRIREE